MLQNNPIGEGMYMNNVIAQYNSIDEFILDDDQPLSYQYLEQKLRKWYRKDPVKVVIYYRYIISKDFGKAPTSLKLLVKEVKEYLRKELLL